MIGEELGVQQHRGGMEHWVRRRAVQKSCKSRKGEEEKTGSDRGGRKLLQSDPGQGVCDSGDESKSNQSNETQCKSITKIYNEVWIYFGNSFKKEMIFSDMDSSE